MKTVPAMRKAENARRRTAMKARRRTAVAVKRKEDDSMMAGKHADMLVEALIRLPLKKLFQFMSVSKLWRSMILQPWFRMYYLKHNPCGLLIRVDDDYWNPSFWHSTLRSKDEDNVAVYPQAFFKSLTIYYDSIKLRSIRALTQTINGLFCIFLIAPTSFARLFLFSVWRGEIMELPIPCLSSHAFGCDYFFGFEPVDGVYKVLAIPMHVHPFEDCHILTLSSSNRDILSWKKLPSGNFDCRWWAKMQSICVNGCLFWFCGQLLISFDLKEEKFRSVHPPNHISYHFTSSWITQFKGRMALFKWDSDVDELVLYSLDDKDGLSWAKHVTMLPSELQRKVRSDIFDDDQGVIWTKYVTHFPKDLQTRLMDYCLPIVVPVGNLPTGLLWGNSLSPCCSDDVISPDISLISYVAWNLILALQLTFFISLYISDCSVLASPPAITLFKCDCFTSFG